MPTLTITANVLTEVVGDGTTPVGVLVKNTGNIPVDAVRSIALEALATFTGGHKATGYRVADNHTFHEKAEVTNTIFAVEKVDK